ncbi:hypothetical protein [Spiroplasma floricola]|uniref:Uncharacterized protein n=1 Tax=Spiroplasma floricola 23-6 TaxID=1336749 RepID=A0A2K8SEX5_9MOLU|nr:hypothetical protein [Spiroplasma floricola]AUB31390.1 hypothetical protein SFLOR_v1c03330 [Spiroplasma floricola 23-6]
MAEKKQFQSILDYRPQFENIVDALVPDIQFSYSAILNNSTVQTYFNMISLEHYGYEYYQLLRMNKLEFKLNERTLNLTILEMVYNIISEIVARKWRYSEYISYDMYILPLRIKKYTKAMNYKFVESESANKKPLWKLVSQPTRVIVEDIGNQYHDDKLNNVIEQFRSTSYKDAEVRLSLFKNISYFVNEGSAVIYERFGKEFTDWYFKEINTLQKYKSESLSTKERKHVEKVIGQIFDISILSILLMSDAMKEGCWKRIKEAEKRRIEKEVTRKTIEEANRKLQAISEQEKEIKKIETKKMDF